MTERYYIGDAEVGLGQTLSLDEEEGHHLAKVMRVPVGARVRVFGAGQEFEATVLATRPSVIVRLDRPLTPLPELPGRLIVAVPWLRSGKTEYLVQKLTELGVHEIAVFRGDHCTARGDETKVPRLCRIAIEACKQCERSAVPQITAWASLKEMVGWLRTRVENLIVLAERTTAFPFSRCLTNMKLRSGMSKGSLQVGVITGPEGGFSKQELEYLSQHATLASLGPRILRADFAPLVATILILAEAGEL